MNTPLSLFRRRFSWGGSTAWSSDRLSRILIFATLAISTPTACTHLPQIDRQKDLAAEQVVARLRQANADLSRFKCIGRITLSEPGQTTRSFRAAMAGRLNDHLRIDLIAPFGGAAGSFSSDGSHLYLVMHQSREYVKRRFGKGSLQRFIKIDITVGDLLDLLVGRIPIGDGLTPRMASSEGGVASHVVLNDQWGRTHQQVTVDAAGRPLEVVWLDGDQQPTLILTIGGWMVVGGFDLPIRIELHSASGERMSVSLERYEANAQLDDGLFFLAPL